MEIGHEVEMRLDEAVQSISYEKFFCGAGWSYDYIVRFGPYSFIFLDFEF